MKIKVSKGTVAFECSPIELNTLRQVVLTFCNQNLGPCPCAFCKQVDEWKDALNKSDDYNVVLNAVTPLNIDA